MRTLVLYNSRYGNTGHLAQQIALAMEGEITLASVGDCPDLNNYDLIIVGTPTHGGRPSEPMRRLLGQLQPNALVGKQVAVFDTRLPWRWLALFGFAAPLLAKMLESKGGTLVVPPNGFLVTGGEGPLKVGELERAAAWAKEILAHAAGPSRTMTDGGTPRAVPGGGPSGR